MNKLIAFGAIVVTTALALMAAASAIRDSHDPRVDADLAALGWLAGSWTGTDGKMEMEEVWMAPKGGAMLGLHRDVAADKIVSWEFLRIAVKNDVITYLASPGGKAATPFPMKEQGDRRVVFENLQHDFPQRILYWIDKDGALHARVEGDKDGKQSPMEWTWTRSGPSSRPK